MCEWVFTMCVWVYQCGYVSVLLLCVCGVGEFYYVCVGGWRFSCVCMCVVGGWLLPCVCVDSAFVLCA